MRSYDFIVGRPRHFVSVQVKSTIADVDGKYLCTVRSGLRAYPPGSFDFLAAYVVLEDCWYIIPEEPILGMESVTLSPGSKRDKYEKYGEAWHLLGPGPTRGTVDNIRACVEEFSAATEKDLHS